MSDDELKAIVEKAINGAMEDSAEGFYRCHNKSNEWQLCPKCNGEGTMQGEVKMMRLGPIASCDVNCDLCNGRKIISKINGLPPEL